MVQPNFDYTAHYLEANRRMKVLYDLLNKKQLPEAKDQVLEIITDLRMVHTAIIANEK